MKKLIYIIIGVITMHGISSYPQNISGTSSEYSFEIYNNKGASLKQAVDINTIAAYESFLAKGYNNKKLNNQAIDYIYILTVKIDAIVGYDDFLQKYSNHSDAGKVADRLYEILFAIAEEENTISSYYGFLVEFPKSQKLLREKAYINMQMLEVEKAIKKYYETNNVDDNELKESFARQLYDEALRARDAGDKYIFLCKCNTLIYSGLLKDTKVSSNLFLDKEQMSSIKGLSNDIRLSSYDINDKISDLIDKIDQINDNQSTLQLMVTSTQNDYSSYLKKIADIWSEQVITWANWVSDGTKLTNWNGSPKSY